MVSDFAAFAVIIGFGLKAGLNSVAVAISRPSIVKTLVQDATIYFFVIFTSHFILVLTLIFERVRTCFILFITSFSSLSLAHSPAHPCGRERRLLPNHDLTADAFAQKSSRYGERLVVVGNYNHPSCGWNAVSAERSWVSPTTFARRRTNPKII